ncbi:MAG: Glycosyl transferase family 2 [Microgenomates group bacterium GW2011_GWF1_38_5]|nr:MAG: Glycosyl transferase family 2 [Microgenomates group bacterium GW2011_GWF1_38_5]
MFTEVVVEGRVGKLKHAKIHHQYETVRDFFEMMNRYSEIDASERVKNGRKYSHFRFLFDPIYNFLVRYFYRLGFLDGWRGFVLSYLMAVYHLIVWVKVGENKIRNSNIEIRNNN